MSTMCALECTCLVTPVSISGGYWRRKLCRLRYDTGWSHTAGSVSSPKQAGVQRETGTIVQRFHFSSALKRMSAIVRVCSSARQLSSS